MSLLGSGGTSCQGGSEFWGEHLNWTKQLQGENDFNGGLLFVDFTNIISKKRSSLDVSWECKLVHASNPKRVQNGEFQGVKRNCLILRWKKFGCSVFRQLPHLWQFLPTGGILGRLHIVSDERSKENMFWAVASWVFWPPDRKVASFVAAMVAKQVPKTQRWMMGCYHPIELLESSHFPCRSVFVGGNEDSTESKSRICLRSRSGGWKSDTGHWAQLRGVGISGNFGPFTSDHGHSWLSLHEIVPWPLLCKIFRYHMFISLSSFLNRMLARVTSLQTLRCLSWTSWLPMTLAWVGVRQVCQMQLDLRK